LPDLKSRTKYLLIRSLKNTLEDIGDIDRNNRNNYDIEKITITYIDKELNGKVPFFKTENVITLDL